MNKTDKTILLDDWQRDILDYEGDLLLCTGRQVGKTTIFAIKAAQYMKKHPNSQIIIVSLTEDQAKLIIVMILTWLEKYAPNMIAKGKNKPTQNKVTLTNKSTALARPVGNTGDAVRGFTGDVLIIDEASRMPELAFIAGEPTLMTTGGQIWMCSTPHGKEGYFWRAYNDKDNWKVVHVSSEDVIFNRKISEGWDEERREKAIRRLQKQKESMSEIHYGQEYLGLFMDDLRRYFDDELIERCCVLKREQVISRKGDYYLGVDIARMGDDESSFEIIRVFNKDNVQHVENITTSKTRTTDTENRILELDRRYNFKKIFIDAGAGTLGVSVFDHLLVLEQTKRKIEAINNRARSYDRENKSRVKLVKEDLYDNLKSMMEKKQLKLLDDENLITSLRGIQIEFVKNKFEETTIKIFGKKGRDGDHIVEGLVRAVQGAKGKNLNLWFRSIRI